MGALASIGIPLANELASKIFGKVWVCQKKAIGLHVAKKPMMMPYYPPPFIGNWPRNNVGMGVKKDPERKRWPLVFSSEKNSPFNNVPILVAIL